MEPVKPKKGKSVTFSQDTGSKSLGIRDKVPRNRAYSEVNKNMKEKQQSTEDEGAISEKENSKLLPIFQVNFIIAYHSVRIVVLIAHLTGVRKKLL